MNGEQRIAGIILCGGASTRMGSPKEWFEIGDETMLQRTVRVMSAVVSPIVVVSRSGQDLPTLPLDVRHVHDEIGGEGPLRGLHAGLCKLAGEADAALVTACDHPELEAEFLKRMIALTNEECDATIVKIPHGKPSPLPGVYRTKLVSTTATLLNEGRRALRDLLHSCRVTTLTAEDFADVESGMGSMLNVNRLEEWERWCNERGGNIGMR